MLKRILARHGAQLDSVEYAALATKLLKNQPIREADLPKFGFDPLASAPTTPASGTASTTSANTSTTISNTNIMSNPTLNTNNYNATSNIASERESEGAMEGASSDGGPRWELRVNEAALRKARTTPVTLSPFTSPHYCLTAPHTCCVGVENAAAEFEGRLARVAATLRARADPRKPCARVPSLHRARPGTPPKLAAALSPFFLSFGALYFFCLLWARY